MPTERLETPAGPHSCTLVTRSGETSPGETARRSQRRCRFGIRLPSLYKDGGREKPPLLPHAAHTRYRETRTNARKIAPLRLLIHLLTIEVLLYGNMTHMT